MTNRDNIVSIEQLIDADMAELDNRIKDLRKRIHETCNRLKVLLNDIDSHDSDSTNTSSEDSDSNESNESENDTRSESDISGNDLSS